MRMVEIQRIDVMNKDIKSGNFDADGLILDVFDLLQALKKKIWLIAVIGILGGIAAYTGTKILVIPTYRTSFTAYVNNRKNVESTTTVTNADLSASQSLANTYAKILVSRSVLTLAAEKINMEKSYSALQNAVSVSIAPDTEILTVSVVMTDPDKAVEYANAISEVSPEYIAGIVEGSSMQIIDQPLAPTGIYEPNYRKNAGMGFIVGAAFACVLIFVFEISDDHVKDEDELRRRYGIAVIGTIPNLSSADKHDMDSNYSVRKG